MPPRATILVVDEDVKFAASLRELLMAAGYRVLTAASSSAAVAALRAFRVQVVITDTLRHSPAAERWSALDAILAAAGDTPCILCTAQDASEYADYAAHGRVALLHKPLEPMALQALVATLLPATYHAATEGGDHALEQIV
jgi:DNA-binding NtrC family response regulator